MPIADVAQTGFKASAAYDAHRPGFPAEAVDKLLSRLEIKGVKHAKVADLAAGTGLFTGLLAARPEEFDIVAIEPHDGMREQLQQKQLQRVKVVEGTAESMSSIADGSLAALTAAQAFHWFSNATALKEIHRVLQPTGVFGMIWNIEDYNAPKEWDIHPGWETTMRDVMWSLEDGFPRFRHLKWKSVFEELNRSGPISILMADPMFGLPLGEDSVVITSWLSKEDIWSRFQTYSQIANLDNAGLEKVKKIFWDAIDAPETEVDDQGRVAVHGQTFFAWASKIPAEPLKSGG